MIAKTDFERLMIARAYVKILEFEKAKMRSTIQKLQHKLKEALESNNQIENLSKEEKIAIKKGHHYRQMKWQMDKLKSENSRLLEKISLLSYNNEKTRNNRS
jgi:hypothetical protein